jgi:hypothetical protein
MRHLNVILCLFFLAGCGTHISAQVEGFAAEPIPRVGERVFVAPPTDAGRASLEMRQYVALAQSQFARRGFNVVDNADAADLIAIIGLGIQDGRDVVQAFTARGLAGPVTTVEVERRFDRSGRLLVTRRAPSGPGSVVFDSRVISTGSCGMLSVVAPPLVEALFSNFPAGGSRTIAVPMPAGPNC